MRNYVKESAFQMQKKISFMNFFSPLLGGIYFLGYSALIFMHNQKYYETFIVFSIPVAIAISFRTLSSLSLSSDEKALQNEIKSARKFLDEAGGKDDSVKINALVSLFRSKRKEMGWSEICEMLSDSEYVKETLGKPWQ